MLQKFKLPNLDDAAASPTSLTASLPSIFVQTCPRAEGEASSLAEGRMLFKAGEKEEEEGSRTKEGVSEEEEDTLEKLDLREVEI